MIGLIVAGAALVLFGVGAKLGSAFADINQRKNSPLADWAYTY